MASSQSDDITSPRGRRGSDLCNTVHRHNLVRKASVGKCEVVTPNGNFEQGSGGVSRGVAVNTTSRHAEQPLPSFLLLFILYIHFLFPTVPMETAPIAHLRKQALAEIQRPVQPSLQTPTTLGRLRLRTLEVCGLYVLGDPDIWGRVVDGYTKTGLGRIRVW